MNKQVTGPWDQEPDYHKFTYKGYNCFIRRHMYGHLCGYVELLMGTPIRHDTAKQAELDVHGGVTFTGFIGDTYYIGFDCAHAGDITPRNMTLGSYFELQKYQTYKDMAYVEREIKLLVDQILDL